MTRESLRRPSFSGREGRKEPAIKLFSHTRSPWVICRRRSETDKKGFARERIMRPLRCRRALPRVIYSALSHSRSLIPCEAALAVVSLWSRGKRAICMHVCVVGGKTPWIEKTRRAGGKRSSFGSSLSGWAFVEFMSCAWFKWSR